MAITNGFLSDRVAVGVAQEATQNTPLTPTIWLPVKSIDIQKTPNTILPAVAAQTAAAYRYAVPGIFKYAGPLVMPLFPDNGMMLLFGALGTDTKTGSGPYTHTAVMRTTGQLKSYTLEENIGGNNLDHQYAGMIVSKAELKFAPNAEAEATYNVEGMSDLVLASATAASWATDTPFSPSTLACSIGASDPTVMACTITIDNKGKAYPAFNGTQNPQIVGGMTREIKVKLTVLLQALNGGAASAGYFADLVESSAATATLVAATFVATQGANTITLGTPKVALTSYKEVMKIGDLIMADLEYTAIENSGSSFVDATLVVVNSQSTAYTS